MRARREYAANLILEDARLRGDLTDDQYGPIQADALRKVDEAAQATKGMREAAARPAIDAAVASAKDEVRERVAAATEPAAAPTLVGRLLQRLRLQP